MQSAGSAYVASDCPTEGLSRTGMSGRGMRVMGGWLLSSEGEHVFSCILALLSSVAARLPMSGGLGRGE